MDMEQLLRDAANESHLHQATFSCVLLTVAALLWCGLHTHRFLFGRVRAYRELLCPAGPARAGTAGSAAGRPQALHFVLIFHGIGAALHAEALVGAAAELRLNRAVVVIGLLGVAALFNSAIQSVHFLVARRPAEGKSKTVLHAIASAESAPTSRAWTSRHPFHHFVVLCLAMDTALNAERLVAAAADLGISSGVVACPLLALTALFNWEIFSLNLRVAGRLAEGESRTARRAIFSTEAAPTCHAPRLHLHHFVVVGLALGAVLDVEQLVAAAAGLGIHSGFVACFLLAVTALFNWEILSLNLCVARRAVERERKTLPRPSATAVRSPHPARFPFLVLAALVSTSWFLEPFAAAAEHCLPKAATAAVVLLFAALFNVSIHVFRSFFLPCPSSPGASAAQRQSATAHVTGIGITVAACLVGAVGSACYVYSPARA